MKPPAVAGARLARPPALAMLAALLLLPAARAQYEPTRLPDPARRWSIDVGLRGEYDDNIFTDDRDEVDSFKAVIEPNVRVNVPTEQTFVGFRYGYRATYFEDRPGDHLDENHNVDLLFSHTFNRRLVLDVNERLRYGVEPEIVELSADTPVILRRRGDFFYNRADASLKYSVHRRWVTLVRGDFEMWDYDSRSSSTNDRYQVGGTAAALYQFDRRTTGGLSYRYGIIDYDRPGPQDARNSTSHIVYGTINRRFNPHLTGNLDAGVELRRFDDGDDDLAPFVDSSLSYGYAEGSAVSGGFRFALTSTENSAYRSADTVSLFGQVDHRFTPKFSATLRALYAFDRFGNVTDAAALAGFRSGHEEEDVRLSVIGRYRVTDWFSAEASYHYDRVFSQFPGGDFTRNRISLGGRVTY
jgi:hypothetical protein